MGCCRDNQDNIRQLQDIQISDPFVGQDELFKEKESSWVHHSTPNFWASTPVPIKVIKVNPDAKVPEKAHSGDMGWDIFCVQDESWQESMFSMDSHKLEKYFELMPHQSHTFSTGIKVGVPDNYGFLLRERSGLGIKDISLGAGVIEGTYRGEWKVHLRNISNKPITFKKGDKICQAILTPIIPAQTELVNELPDTKRGEKGFGSSGR